jgi:hypothetical protein
MENTEKLPEFTVFPTSVLGQVSWLATASSCSLYAVHYNTRNNNVRRAMRVAQPLNVGVKAFAYGTLLCFGIFTGLLAVSIGVTGVTKLEDLKSKLKKDVIYDSNEDVKAMNKIQNTIRTKLKQFGVNLSKIEDDDNDEAIDWNAIFKEEKNNKDKDKNNNNSNDKK